jgi:ABC-type Fe3+ transport system substrate-binding protein
MFGYNGNLYSSVALFNADTGFEANGVGGMEGLANPASNFMLTGTSQCIERGNPAVGIAVDYGDYLFATPPSSGAYQYR